MTTYEQDAEFYAIAMEHAGDVWICEHVDEFKQLAADATASYSGELGGFRRRMALPAQLAGAAAGFPTFTQWLAEKYPTQAAA
ncbi:MAG: hypothetical protein JWM95_1734 [Gemmatimonadetes bacterium]|nr:hypothetical protein [Gemmatimonadota bacterium]